MTFPESRPRRLRSTPVIRGMVAETRLSAADFIAPLFFDARICRPEPINAMPGQQRWPVEAAAEVCGPLAEAGVNAVMLFGLPDYKDDEGSSSWQDTGVVQQAIAEIRRSCPEMLIITDVCLCEYTSHGHCGLLDGNSVDNDRTLPLLARQALSHIEAGADIVAPSDMMDGRVGAIRGALDMHGHSDTPIMAYSAKYASAFYGPFREAAESTPSFGDRRSYQMDPANVREALKEVSLDLAEGADIVMVKPALSYLDVIHRVREAVQVPVAAYNVSGEYSMIKAAGAAGWIDEERAVREVLTSIKRAGADLIISYHSLEAALAIRSGRWS
ncbi:MAG: hemB [Chloroflexi bacterium]|nr:hemB [Chloroflexota bacterium]